MIFLVTGGSGFLGKAIVQELLEKENAGLISELRILDLREPEKEWQEKVRFIKSNICDNEIVIQACKGVDVVIHSAAIVDWGNQTEEAVMNVNVGGTENVIKACKENKVPYLIYTSSLDAIFGGKPLKDIDETIPYPEKHITTYCKSKYLAEIKVKEANSEALKTCILRPSDIYGENDPYHIDSLIDMAKNGFYVRLGNGTSKCQHVYVRNMAHAHVLVAKAFINKNTSIEGNAYFITDGPGTNFFKFFDRVVIGAGYNIWPRNLWLPRWLAYSMGSMAEFFAWLVRPIKRYNPKFSRFAVVYTCSDFTFSANKAKKDFGYVPKFSDEEALDRTVAFYKKQRENS